MKMIIRNLGKLFFYFACNSLALYAASLFVRGFSLTGNPGEFLKIAGVFTLINIFVKPIFKFILKPFVILTLGLGTIAINMAMLYSLAVFFPQGIGIAGLIPLLYATLIVVIVNLFAHLFGKFFRRKETE